MLRLMAENNVKPESMEIKATYIPKLRAFRKRLQPFQLGAAAASVDAKVRASLTHEMSELTKLHAAFKTAAVKDSLTYNLPINPLPKLASTLDEELSQRRLLRHSLHPRKCVRWWHTG